MAPILSENSCVPSIEIKRGTLSGLLRVRILLNLAIVVKPYEYFVKMNTSFELEIISISSL